MARGLSAAIFIGLCVAIYFAAQRFYSDFPQGWPWGEQLLNYQGGIIKRALLGEIALRLSSVVPARELIIAAVATSYIAVIGLMVFYLQLPFRFAGLLFLLSPGGVLFPFFDVSAAFGRKDIYVILALLLGLLLVVEVRRTIPLFIALFSLYAVIGMMIELAWFYFAIVVAVWAWLRQDDVRGPERLVAAVLSAAYVVGCLLVSNAIGHGADLDAVTPIWKAVYPNVLFPDRFPPLCCINYSWGSALEAASRQLPSGNNFHVAFLLAAIPFAALAATSWKQRLVPQPTFLTTLVAAGALAAAVGPLMLAADWGRYIYLLVTHAFIALWVVTYRPRPAGALSHWLPAQLLVALAFGSSWVMAHWAPAGISALNAGALSRWAIQLVQ